MKQFHHHINHKPWREERAPHNLGKINHSFRIFPPKMTTIKRRRQTFPTQRLIQIFLTEPPLPNLYRNNPDLHFWSSSNDHHYTPRKPMKSLHHTCKKISGNPKRRPKPYNYKDPYSFKKEPHLKPSSNQNNQSPSYSASQHVKQS